MRSQREVKVQRLPGTQFTFNIKSDKAAQHDSYRQKHTAVIKTVLTMQNGGKRNKRKQRCTRIRRGLWSKALFISVSSFVKILKIGFIIFDSVYTWKSVFGVSVWTVVPVELESQVVPNSLTWVVRIKSGPLQERCSLRTAELSPGPAQWFSFLESMFKKTQQYRGWAYDIRN